jgi:cytochrome c biogenesis protein ResB
MTNIKRVLIWLSLTVIMLLVVFSIFGAFIGSKNAGVFFNSAPLAVYWFIFLVFLLCGFLVYPRLVKKPSLMLMHIGCVLILVGGLWGSKTSQELQKKYLGRDKVAKGHMIIYEGQEENSILKVVDEKYKKVGELNFSIRLDDFRMEYYERGNVQVPTVHINLAGGGHWDLEAAVGKEVDLGSAGKIKVLHVYQRLRLIIEEEGMVAQEDHEGMDNPAVEIEIVNADGTSVKKYVYAYFPDFSKDVDGLKLEYEFPQLSGMVKDYFSDLVVIKDGKEVLKKTIEVNDPLYYGGYHFYQSDYDHQNGRYTVLSLTSDTGLYAVFTGFFLLCVGVIWQFWGKIKFDTLADVNLDGGPA